MTVSQKICRNIAGRYIKEATDWANGSHRSNHYRYLNRQAIERRYYWYLENAVINLLYSLEEGRPEE